MSFTLSPTTATFFIINVMIGSGIFVNTALLEKIAPHISFASYALVGLLMLPIVTICFYLLSFYPHFSLFQLGSVIHPLLGSCMGWGYFFGKLATMTIGICVGTKLLFHAQNDIVTFFISLLFILLFYFFAQKNFAFGGNAPLFFCTAKIIPILFVILTALFAYQKPEIVGSLDSANIHTIFSCIPFVVFAFAGFESLFTISSRVKNQKKNALRVTFVAFFTVFTCYVLYQYAAGILVDRDLIGSSDFIYVFSTLLQKTFLSGELTHTFARIAIACSALGASYGVFVATACNVQSLLLSYTLPASISYLLTAGIASFYLIFLKGIHGTPLLLQQLSALGTFLTYAYFIFIYSREKNRRSLVLWLGIINWCVIAYGMVQTLYTHNFLGYFWYFALVGIAVTINHCIQKR